MIDRAVNYCNNRFVAGNHTCGMSSFGRRRDSTDWVVLLWMCVFVFSAKWRTSCREHPSRFLNVNTVVPHQDVNTAASEETSQRLHQRLCDLWQVGNVNSSWLVYLCGLTGENWFFFVFFKQVLSSSCTIQTSLVSCSSLSCNVVCMNTMETRNCPFEPFTLSPVVQGVSLCGLQLCTRFWPLSQILRKTLCLFRDFKSPKTVKWKRMTRRSPSAESTEARSPKCDATHAVWKLWKIFPRTRWWIMEATAHGELIFPVISNVISTWVYQNYVS